MCAVKSRQNYNLAANSKYKGAAASVQCVQTELTAVTSVHMASSFCLSFVYLVRSCQSGGTCYGFSAQFIFFPLTVTMCVHIKVSDRV